MGYYIRNRTGTDAAGQALGAPEDSPLFLLGGPNTVRGFEQNFLGPFRILPREEVAIEPSGGEGLFSFSQEITYDTLLYGMGITPFVDGGLVWGNYDQIFDNELVMSWGLGLSFDTPVGYFRIDYARPFRDASLEMLIEQTLDMDLPVDATPEERQMARDAIENRIYSEWSFRFGRTF
jgi:outer membrane protein assembly factor BamA